MRSIKNIKSAGKKAVSKMKDFMFEVIVHGAAAMIISFNQIIAPGEPIIEYTQGL